MNEPAVDQTTKNTGKRARVNVHELGESTRSDLRIAPDETDHDALHARHAELGLHSFRTSLQTMIDSPKETHEIERDAESARVTGQGGLRGP